VSFLAFCDLHVALGVGVLAAVHERALVSPPDNLSPVIFIVLKELFIELKVFTDAQHDLILGDAWLLSRRAVVPSALAVMESSDRAGDIYDGHFFGLLVLQLDSTEFGVFIVRHKMDSTLGELLKEETRMDLSVNQVLEFRAVVINELQVLGSDLEVQFQTLRREIEQGFLVVNASQPPVFVRVVGAAGLQHGERSEFGGREGDRSRGSLELAIPSNGIDRP